MDLLTKISDLKHYKKIHNLDTLISQEEINLLAKDVPIQKIVGFINFDNLKILVNHKVLIPRYETEELVNLVLKLINQDSKVLDLGCGSGYIGLTIKQKVNCSVTLSDIDLLAIKQTKINAKLNDLDVQIIYSDMFSNMNQKFNLIVANPPYIPNKTKLDKSVIDYEPHHALFAGIDGNDFYKIILDQGPEWLEPQGYIVLEISEDNKPYLESHGFIIINDINQKARIAFKQY